MSQLLQFPISGFLVEVTTRGAFEVGSTRKGSILVGARGDWHRSARPAEGARRRLTNPRSPGWLPTFPAA